jgi:restriction endonuclease S subunit
LDTGLYTKEFKTIEFLIKNYTNGFYYLDAKDLKSGSTPKENERIFDFGNINWLTPTNIADTGIMNAIPKIAIKNKKYNITKDCVLFINRTSKGTKGEHVGISFFYDYNKLGKGQHNQGLYRLDNRSKDELLYLSSYLNSELARKLCSNISMGSKMKEMKSMDFEKLPIPSFGIGIQQQLAKLYYNQNDDYLKHIEKFNITSFNKIDLEVNRNSGIIDLNLQIQIIKSIIKNNINEMIK